MIYYIDRKQRSMKLMDETISTIGTISFLDIVSIVADFAGVISLILSVLTFINTYRIKSSLQAHLEESDFKLEIDNSILRLEAFEKLFIDEYKTLDYNNITNLQIEIDNIITAYEEILPKGLIKSLQSLHKYLQDNFTPANLPYSQTTCHECAKKLNRTVSLLKKKKRMIP